MKNCPSCQTPNLDNAQFCQNCGISFPANRICPRCNGNLSGTARFCPTCGFAVPPAAKAGSPLPGSSITGQLPLNTVLGERYLILGKLGHGGMGAVYQATDAHLSNKMVALKEMSDAAMVDPVERQQALDAFRREAHLLSSLAHPCLPRVTDFFSQGNKQYLAMDFVEGCTLSDLLSNRLTPFPEAQVLQWADQLCDVLQYLHSHNPPIVFRDLKPGNIMVSNDMQNVKLIDFGIARLFKPGARKDTVLLGTPGYAPPEQYGKGQSDARSDVYALGATLHHLLSLRDPADRPFKFPMLRSLNPAVSPQVEQAVMRAVEQNPALRWDSTQTLRDALHKATPIPQPAPKIVTAAPVPLSAPSLAAPVVYTKSAFSVPSVSPLQYAAHGPRLAAFLIDAMMSGSITLLAIALIQYVSTGLGFALLLLGLLWLFGYYAIPHAHSGQTPGKKFLKIKVVRRDGARLSRLRAWWRSLAFILPPLLLLIPFAGVPLGYLLYGWPLFHKQHRAFHDLLSDTCVIKA
jgi:serine/threonine-protein kinase